jgi:predicted DNA-binding transcriptional regulator AlpA
VPNDEMDHGWASKPDEPRRMLNIDQVLAIVPVSRTTLFRMERDRQFPTSHNISPNRRAWYADEVLAWQRALPANSRISRRAAKISSEPNAKGRRFSQTCGET